MLFHLTDSLHPEILRGNVSLLLLLLDFGYAGFLLSDVILKSSTGVVLLLFSRDEVRVCFDPRCWFFTDFSWTSSFCARLLWSCLTCVLRPSSWMVIFSLGELRLLALARLLIAAAGLWAAAD